MSLLSRIAFVCTFQLVLSNSALAQTGPLDAIKAELKHPDKPFTLVVTLEVKPTEVKKFREVMKEAIAKTLKEEGVLRYELNQDTKKPETFVLYERWKNLKAVQFHFEQSYLQNLLQALPDVTTNVEIKVMLPADE